MGGQGLAPAGSSWVDAEGGSGAQVVLPTASVAGRLSEACTAVATSSRSKTSAPGGEAQQGIGSGKGPSSSLAASGAATSTAAAAPPAGACQPSGGSAAAGDASAVAASLLAAAVAAASASAASASASASRPRSAETSARAAAPAAAGPGWPRGWLGEIGLLSPAVRLGTVSGALAGARLVRCAVVYGGWEGIAAGLWRASQSDAGRVLRRLERDWHVGDVVEVDRELLGARRFPWAVADVHGEPRFWRAAQLGRRQGGLAVLVGDAVAVLRLPDGAPVDEGEFQYVLGQLRATAGGDEARRAGAEVLAELTADALCPLMPGLWRAREAARRYVAAAQAGPGGKASTPQSVATRADVLLVAKAVEAAADDTPGRAASLARRRLSAWVSRLAAPPLVGAEGGGRGDDEEDDFFDRASPGDLGGIAEAIGAPWRPRRPLKLPTHAAVAAGQLAAAQPYAWAAAAADLLGLGGDADAVWSVAAHLHEVGPADMTPALADEARRTGQPVQPVRQPRLLAEEQRVHLELIKERVQLGVLEEVAGAAALPPNLIAVSSSFPVARGDMAGPDGRDVNTLSPAQLARAAMALGEAIAGKAGELLAAHPEDGAAAAVRRAFAACRAEPKWRLIFAADSHNDYTVSARRGRWSSHTALTMVEGFRRGAAWATTDATSYFFCFVLRPCWVPYLGIQSCGEEGTIKRYVFKRGAMGPWYMPDYANLASSFVTYVANLKLRRRLRDGSTEVRHMADDFGIGAQPQADVLGACQRGLEVTIETLGEGGVVAAVKKTRPPSMQPLLLGRAHDTSAGTFSLPPATAYRYIASLTAFRYMLKTPALQAGLAGGQVRQLAGKMTWYGATSALGHGYVQALHALAAAKGLDEFVPRIKQALLDIDWWLQRFSFGTIEPLPTLRGGGAADAIIYSDSCDYAVCAVAKLGQERPRGVYGRFCVAELGAAIAPKELAGTLLGLQLLDGAPPGTLVLTTTDSAANAAGLCRGSMRTSGAGGTEAKDLVRKVLAYVERRGWRLLACALPREGNRVADRGSYAKTFADAQEALKRDGVGDVADVSDYALIYGDAETGGAGQALRRAFSRVGAPAVSRR